MRQFMHDESQTRSRRAVARAVGSLLPLLFSVAFSISCEASSTPAAAGGLRGVEAIRDFISGAPINKDDKGAWKQRLPTPPKVPFDKSKKYFWLLETNVGSMKIELLADEAPMHASSTIYLTELGFYDDVVFHRVIPGFMAQGGDPTGSGRGGPGYKYAGEFGGDSKHDGPGVLSMANAGPGTDGSQFFITFKATPHLNERHTVFGRVVEGMGTVRELEKNGSPGRGTPKQDLRIRKATIIVE
ncbi:MAG: peptidylprolyl isomerase [Myxococcota bacterium]|nr:peptidylprolyl isomerase [Myxococcota bacterium]